MRDITAMDSGHPHNPSFCLQLIFVILLTYRLFQPSSPIGNDLHEGFVTSAAISTQSHRGHKLSSLKLTRSQHDRHQQKRVEHLCLSSLILLLAGDVQINPGPKGKAVSIYPCGYCEKPVNWSHLAVCCDNCSIWYHKSCENLDTEDMSRLGHESVAWHCYKCGNINIDSFTFNSFQLRTSNEYYPLSEDASSIGIASFSSENPPSPIFISSPKQHGGADSKRPSSGSVRSHHSTSGSQSSQQTSSTSSNLRTEKKSNLRVLTVNCCSIRKNKSEFAAAVDYIKPDIICGTESWLSGIKPGMNPAHDAIKSSEVFPQSHIFYRNDRESAGGGVFVGVSKSTTSDNKPELSTKCEVVWTKIRRLGTIFWLGVLRI